MATWSKHSTLGGLFREIVASEETHDATCIIIGIGRFFWLANIIFLLFFVEEKTSHQESSDKVLVP